MAIRQSRSVCETSKRRHAHHNADLRRRAIRIKGNPGFMTVTARPDLTGTRLTLGRYMGDAILDCLVVGGGPAGLTAAIYLSRYHLDILVVDGGKSRAALDPDQPQPCRLSRGINGTSCFERMKDQARRYGTRIEDGQVTRIERGEDGLFGAEMARARSWRAPSCSPRGLQPPTADRSRTARRRAGGRPDPLLPDLRRL